MIQQAAKSLPALGAKPILWGQEGVGQMEAMSPIDERRIGWLSALAWSPRGRQLAVASGEAIRIHSWSAKDRLGERPLRQFGGHDAPIRCLAFHRQGHILASGAADGRTFLWRSDGSGHCIEKRSEAIQALCFSPWG